MKKKYLEYRGYTGSVELSIEDDCIFGEVLFVRDLVTYEAQTVTELQKEFHVAVDDYLETCTELGLEPKKPCSGTFNVRIGPDLHQKAVEHALRSGIKLNEFVKDAVQAKLEKNNVLHHHVHSHVHSVSYRQEFNLDGLLSQKGNDEKNTFRNFSLDHGETVKH